MATKKDLVEAYSFSRRRLVTAFVSGAPGGREVEPTPPRSHHHRRHRAAVLLVAGAPCSASSSRPRRSTSDKEGLISEKDTGADYVNIAPAEGGEPELRPVINITSAMLLLGADVESMEIDPDDLADQHQGRHDRDPRRRPTTPPDVAKLIQTGWTSCTSSVGGTPKASAPG